MNERSVLIPIFSPKEQQRIYQYSYLLHCAEDYEKRLKNGERLIIQANCSDDPKQKPLDVMEVTQRHPPIFREMAFHMYEGYFKGDTRLEATAEEIQKDIQQQKDVEKAQEDYQLESMWNS